MLKTNSNVSKLIIYLSGLKDLTDKATGENQKYFLRIIDGLPKHIQTNGSSTCQ
jgi:hypothetical protein